MESDSTPQAIEADSGRIPGTDPAPADRGGDAQDSSGAADSGKPHKDDRPGAGLLFWGRSQQPTGLEGEGFFLDIVPKVDAVDFHDAGEEEGGNYDLIVDPVTEETFKVAKDQRIEFLASGSGPRLERARARAERALNHSRRRSLKENGSGPHVRSSEEDSSESDFSSSSGNSKGHEDQDRVGKRSDASAGSGVGGVGARGKRQGHLETKAYWPEAPPGVFASSTSETSEDFDACDGDASWGFGFEDDAVTRRHRPKSQARVGAGVAGVDVADVALKRVEDCNDDVAAASELGVDATEVSTKTDLTARRGAAGESTSIEMNDTAHVLGVYGEKGFPLISRKGKGREREEEELNEKMRRRKTDIYGGAAMLRADGARDGQLRLGSGVLENEAEDEDEVDSDDNGDEQESTKQGKGGEGILSAVQKLGLRAEFMPVAQGDWEAEVILTDDYHVGDGNTSQSFKNQARPAAAALGAPAIASPTAMSMSGDDDDETKKKIRRAEKEREESKTRDAGKDKDRDGKDGGKDEGEQSSRGGKMVGKPLDGRGGGATEAGGAGRKSNKNPHRDATKARADLGFRVRAEFEPRVTAFPAKEGEAWVDPPSFLNLQIDMGSNWEDEVILNDSQKPRRAKIPMRLDDPDKRYGTLPTPRPTLKILRTETQQENTHIMERTSRRQMALEKQKRLRDAAFKTGYTINTLGEGKASRAESHIRAVVIRPPPHASPAEDKVLINTPKSWEEIRNLHRPRMALSMLIPLQPCVVRLPRKPKVEAGGRHGAGLGARIGEILSMPMHREKDLLPLDSRSTFVMMEYVEERPPLLASTGMASKIITFARSSSRRTIVGGEGLRAHIHRHGSFVRRFPLPPPVSPAQCRGAVPSDSYRKMWVRRASESVELSPQEDSPFLGEIRPGSEQPAVCNGLFRAPIFKHTAPDSDFLLIREPLSKREKERMSQQQKTKEKPAKVNKFFGGGSVGLGGAGGGSSASSLAAAAALKTPVRPSQYYVIRPMPVVFLVGQTEPQMEALEPTKPSSKTTHLNIMSFLAKRVFEITKVAQAGNAGIPFKKILEEVKFLSLPRAKDATKARLKDIVRDIAERRDMKDDPEGPIDSNSLWAVKPDRDMPQDTAQAAKLFRCEDVCALESMVSAWAHLSQIGVDSLTSHDAVAKALVKIKTRHDTLLAQVKEVRSAAATLSKKKNTLTRAARAKKLPPPDPNGGLSRQLTCMEKLSEVLGNQLTELKRVRAVAQYMHKELQMVPWTLTANYLKHRGMGSSQATFLLRLSGDGDPSGCGEGFSFLMRQAEQAKTSSALTSSQKIAADRSVQKVTGTSGDLRRLTMLQLASTCEAMGIPKETVKTLRRWDRVHMIKELAGVAVAENVQDQNIYARFVRRRRPNATIDKDLYRATCNEIWERQISSLSATADDVDGYGSESATGRGKSRPRSRGAASSDGNSDVGGGDEGEEDDGDINDNDIDDDDGLDVDDLMSDMEETLEEGDGDGDNPVPKSLQDLTASANRDRDELDDERQLRQLQKDLHEDRQGEAARWGAPEEPPQKSRVEELMAKLGGRAELPTQAVRRITRTIGPDGTETVRVSYSLKRQDLVRLDARGGKKQSGASKSGGGGAAGASGGGSVGGSPLGFFLPRPQASAEVKAAALQDKASSGGQEEVLKIRLNTKTIMAPKDKKRKRAAGEGARRMVPEENIYVMKRQNSRLTVESRDRLPRNRMRNLLTDVMKKLVGREDSLNFRAPVKRALYPDYFTMIKKPIDLRTMQEKNNAFEYFTREALLADMRQMAENASAYNGHDDPIAQAARKLLADCEEQLENPEIEEVEKELIEERQAGYNKSKKRRSGGSANEGAGVGGAKGKSSSAKKRPTPTKSRASPISARVDTVNSSQERALALSSSILGPPSSSSTAATTTSKTNPFNTMKSSGAIPSPLTPASKTYAPSLPRSAPLPMQPLFQARTGGAAVVANVPPPQQPPPPQPLPQQQPQPPHQQPQPPQQQPPPPRAPQAAFAPAPARSPPKAAPSGLEIAQRVEPGGGVLGAGGIGVLEEGGTSSDSSDGEEVVEAGGTIGF